MLFQCSTKKQVVFIYSQFHSNLNVWIELISYLCHNIVAICWDINHVLKYDSTFAFHVYSGTIVTLGEGACACTDQWVTHGYSIFTGWEPGESMTVLAQCKCMLSTYSNKEVLYRYRKVHLGKLTAPLHGQPCHSVPSYPTCPVFVVCIAI